MAPNITGTQVTDTRAEVGTMHGHRGIRFNFIVADGTRANITFDFYGNAAQWNGATYARLESVALAAMVRAGYKIDSFTHFLIG